MKYNAQGFRSLRTKTIISLSVVAIFMILSIFFVLQTAMMSRILELENRYVTEHVQRTLNSIDGETERLASIAQDWAVWDDTYSFIIEGDESYIRRNALDLSTFANLQIDMMAFVSRSGEYIFASETDIAEENIIPVSPSITEYMKNTPLLRNIDPDYKMQGLIMLPEGPMLIASSPILTSNGAGPVAGNLIIGIKLDEAEISQLSNQLQLPIAIKNLGSLEQIKSNANDTGVFVEDKQQNKITGYSVLNDVAGQPALVASITMNREISLIGQKGIAVVFTIMISVSLFCGFIILLFLNKHILSRLSQLVAEVRHIGMDESFSTRLKPGKMHDEIQLVSEEINLMMDELEKAHQRLLKTDEDLRSINVNLENRVEERTSELTTVNKKLEKEISERMKAEETIKHLAFHDYLTGLPNRLYFLNHLSDIIHQSNCCEKALAIMFLDLDGFKMVNDTWGHTTGDQLLKEVSSRLTEVAGKYDIVARMGGDEFIFLIDNIANTECIQNVSQKILRCSIGLSF